ncbi:MAG TPA: ATP-binding protein [Vicinamibacterales bacterium]|nr:ATP-binding protein [Vicinamibacterales bacterium]
MNRWFASLPIHRKLVVMVLAVSTAAVAAAVVGLLAFDIARFRTTAVDDARAFAEVIAANSAAAIVFDDPHAARQILDSVQVRPVIARACVYRANGTLLASYVRANAVCPTAPTSSLGWRAVATDVPVVRGGRTVGSVFVERRLSDLPGRVIVTAGVAMLMLLAAAALALGLAQRMQQVISRPIVALAQAARDVGADRLEIPPIAAPPDETGALVGAFADMVQRLRAGNAERERLLAREREASRLKDEFLAAVSHELRTPLNAVLGWVQILERTRPSEQTIAKAIESVARNARAQSRVIEDLLDVSRMISGKLQLRTAVMDLHVALESAVEVIGPLAVAKRVQLAVRAPDTPCLIQGDFDRVRQVLWNLLSNAVKFTPAGGRIDAILTDTADGFSVAIVDNGIGIDPAFLPYVFDRFRQADGSTTREHGGLGLGLAIVKELTERHQGTIQASSAGIGHGATFTATFPKLLGSLTEAQVASRVADAMAMGEALKGLRVFAIDDNVDALDIVASALTAAAADVRTFSSPLDALDQIRRSPPDVVLCDLAMPALDGFEVLKRIRDLDAALSRRIPVIAVTAYASDDYRNRCRRAGFAGHLAKPYDTDDLVRGVLGVVSRV